MHVKGGMQGTDMDTSDAPKSTAIEPVLNIITAGMWNNIIRCVYWLHISSNTE